MDFSLYKLTQDLGYIFQGARVQSYPSSLLEVVLKLLKLITTVGTTGSIKADMEVFVLFSINAIIGYFFPHKSYKYWVYNYDSSCTLGICMTYMENK